jgi:hypothetical protein
LFAKEYGWSKNQTLYEVYPDELTFYFKRIQKDRIDERLTELAIIHNPHTKEPNKLINNWKKAKAQLDGRSYLQKEKMDAKDIKQFKDMQRLMRTNAEKRRKQKA